MIDNNPFMRWLAWQMQIVALRIMVLAATLDHSLLLQLIQEYLIIITVLGPEVELATVEILWPEILSSKRTNFNSNSQPRSNLISTLTVLFNSK